MRFPRLRRPATRSGSEATMSLVEHLTELRSRILKALLAVVAGAVVGFFLYETVLDFLVEPYCDVKLERSPGSTCKLVVTDPLESFSIRLKLSTYLGLLIA